MKKRNSFIVLTIILIILVIICIRVLSFKTIDYKFNINGRNINISETYNKKNYYIEIKTEKNIYPLQIYNYLRNNRKIIKNIYLYEDSEFECILPIIDGKVFTDIMCYKDEIIYNYHDLIGKNEDLDSFAMNIEEYDVDIFNESFKLSKSIQTIKYNELNGFNKVVAMTTYDGLIIDDTKITLFDNDVYNNKISTFIDKYYFIADYSNMYSFNYFYIIDISNKEIKKLKSRDEISYDSYIQGIVDNKIYLYDRDNENQYEIDIKNNKIQIISSRDYIRYYNNSKWRKVNKVKANKELYFEIDSFSTNFIDYDYVIGAYDIYYLFKKSYGTYKLYKVYKNNLTSVKFLAEVPTTDIKFNEDYIYYVFSNKLYYYSDSTGLRIILENSELEFNDTIKYYIY